VWAIVALCLALSAIGLVAIRSFEESLKLHGSFGSLDIFTVEIADSNDTWVETLSSIF